MSNGAMEGRAADSRPRVGAGRTVGELTGFAVLSGFVLATIEEFWPGVLSASYMEHLDAVLLIVFAGLATLFRDRKYEAPLRSSMPRSIVLAALTGALLLPGVTGCRTLEAARDLDNVGAVDLAIESALKATGEALEQRDRILEDIEARRIDPLDGRRTFNRIGTGIRAVHVAVGAAEIGRRAGDADMGALAGDILMAVGNLYEFIRSEVE